MVLAPVGEPVVDTVPLAVAVEDGVPVRDGVLLQDGVTDGVCVLLDVAVSLELCVCVGLGHGSHTITFMEAEPNCVRQTSGSVRKRAVVLPGSEHVALAALPDAIVGESVVVQAVLFSHT